MSSHPCSFSFLPDPYSKRLSCKRTTPSHGDHNRLDNDKLHDLRPCNAVGALIRATAVRSRSLYQTQESGHKFSFERVGGRLEVSRNIASKGISMPPKRVSTPTLA